MKLTIRLLCIAAIALFAAGCLSISQYHLGYHNFGNGKMAHSVVSQSSVVGIEEFEERCVKDFISYKVESLKPVFAPKLGKTMDSATLVALNAKLKSIYGFSGGYERLQMIPRKTMLDEATGKNAFDYYDLVNANYLLKGTANAILGLYMIKVDGEVQLAGFDVKDYGQNPNGNNPPIKYIFPESIDKARMTVRYYKRVE